ncbi:hypothetical protein Ddye_007111 [Dipteronia dyeriana]|uniref:DUF1985 domain-containing protein n=1 Tax=Dipteronia dyeriana TaxID=168575 RepID=A0AAD9XKC1_9ROSI|nr:hypothetical protein Ddye_007111 [Dipteronia dyeriana]
MIRFSPVEFYLVSGLTFGAYSESTLELFKRKDSRLRRSYFQDSKVQVKMIIDWFRNLGPNNKYSDDDIVKLTLILILEMTLVGKDDRTSILYWALELVDDLDAFNKFPWGSFLYDMTFNSLSTFLLGRDDKFKNKFIDKLKEKVDSPVKQKVGRYNVWAIEAIAKWVTLGYAVRVNNVAPRILNWQCTETPTFMEIHKTIFKLKNLTIYKNLGPSDEEARKPYWMGMDQLQYVSSNVDGCGDEDDDEDDVEDDADDTNHDDIEDDFYAEFTEKLNEENTIDVSQHENIHDYQSSVPRVVKSPEFVVVSETSGDVKQLTRPPKLTIKVPRDHKRSAFTVSPYIDPTAKRPRNRKCQNLEALAKWMRKFMYTELLEAKPAWFKLLLSTNGWLEGDAKIQGRWSTITKGKKQFKHETYQWDNTMLDYVIGKSLCMLQYIGGQSTESNCGVFTLKFLEYL